MTVIQIGKLLAVAPVPKPPGATEKSGMMRLSGGGGFGFGNPYGATIKLRSKPWEMVSYPD